MIKRNVVNKLVKSHSKKSYKGKKYFYINAAFFFKLLYKFEHVSYKSKKWLFKRLAKSRLVSNYRLLFMHSQKFIGNKHFIHFLDPLAQIFFRFSFVFLISLNFFKLTDFHLELIRRFARKIFGKKVFINLFIKASFIVLRRANQVRMGGGKGSKIFKKIYFIYPGCPILEIRGITFKFVAEFNKHLKKKLPFLYKLVVINRC